MRETRLSGSVEGVVSNHDPYSDCLYLRLFGWSPGGLGDQQYTPDRLVNATSSRFSIYGLRLRQRWLAQFADFVALKFLLR